MATAQQVFSAIGEVTAVSDTILTLIKGLDPGVAVLAETAKQILDLTSGLVGKALAALTAAQGMAITAASIESLAPDPEPLTPPTA